MTIDEFEATTVALSDALARAHAIEAAVPLMLTSELREVGRRQLAARSEIERCAARLRGAVERRPARSGREGA